MTSKPKKALPALTLLLFCTAAMGAAFLYVTVQQNKVRAREEQIEKLKKSEAELKAAAEKIQKREKTAVLTNKNLRGQARQFDEQRKMIITQVRNSVASFETFRQSATAEIDRLKESVTSLETEKKATEEKLQSVENLSKAEKEKLNDEVSSLSKKISELKTTQSQLSDTLKNKDNASMVRDTAKLHYNLGNYYFRNTEYAHAAAEYKKAVFYRPTDPDANYNLALVSADFLDDRQTAIFRYKRYLELVPDAKDRKKINQKILDLQITGEVMEDTAPSKETEVFGPRSTY